MCLDKAAMGWAHAWMTKGDVPPGAVGLAYMLKGGSDASNTDPHAAAPASGVEWVNTGPHLMLFNMGEALQDYPRQGENPDTSAPYVM